VVAFEGVPVENPDRHDHVPNGRAREPLTDQPIDEPLQVATGNGREPLRAEVVEHIGDEDAAVLARWRSDSRRSA